MHTIYGVGGYATLANVFFLLSGFASDLLLIRIWLVCSYAFLLVFGVLGYPPWGQWGQATPTILELGGILWPAFVLLLHVYHTLVLIWDERPIRFKTNDEEQLWRLFYRRSGMGRLEMKIALKLGKWKRYKAGDIIFDLSDNFTHAQRLSMHLIVEGVGEYERVHRATPMPLYSGFLLNLKVGNAWGVYLGQEQSGMSKVTAVTDCLIFVWDFDAVRQMTGPASPALAVFWRNYILYSVGSALSDTSGELYSSNGEVEHPGVKYGGRTRDMTLPLAPHELPKHSVGGFFAWMLQKHNPIPPSGQRHHGMPPSGMLAQGRILAETSGASYKPGEADWKVPHFRSSVGSDETDTEATYLPL